MPYVGLDQDNNIKVISDDPQPFAPHWRDENDEGVLALRIHSNPQADYQRAVETKIEAVARERLYSNAVSFASYAASTNPTWQAEATTFIAWRDSVWEYAYAQLALVQAGEQAPPSSVEAFIADLPAIVWPT